MDKDKAVSILQFYSTIDGMIQWHLQEAADLEATYYTPPAPRVSAALGGAKRVSKPTEAMAVMVPDGILEDVEDHRRKAVALRHLKKAIGAELARLPYVERVAVVDFHIKGDSWEHISERLHYSDRWCRDYRDKALAKLARRFKASKIIAGFEYPE